MLLKDTLLYAAPLKGRTFKWYIYLCMGKGLGHSLELSPVFVPSAIEQGRGNNCYPATVQKLRTDTLLALKKKSEGAQNPHWCLKELHSWQGKNCPLSSQTWQPSAQAPSVKQ